MSTQENRRAPYGQQYGSNYPPSPFGIMRRMSDEMERMFGDFMMPFAGSFGPSSQRFGSHPMQGGPFNQWGNQWIPPLEVFERNNRFVVRAELPGMNRKDVRVEIEDDMLTISGERREEQEDTRQGYRHNERRFGRFFRRIPLPEGTDPDEVQASFKDGLLEVEVPLHQPEHRSRQIDIKEGQFTH